MICPMCCENVPNLTAISRMTDEEICTDCGREEAIQELMER